MLETILGATGNSAPGVSFVVLPTSSSFNSGNTVNFTIRPDNPIVGHVYGWSLAGTLDPELIDGPLSGTFSFTDTEDVTVGIKTLTDGFKDTSETLVLNVHPTETSETVLAESSPVTVVYSSHPTGGHLQVAPESREWTVPDEVTKLSAVCVGGGQGADGTPRGKGGNGGDLRWRNDIPVVPGEVLTLEVGPGGTNSADLATRQGKTTRLKRGDSVLLSAAGGGAIDSSDFTETIGGGDGGSGAEGGENGPGGGGGAGGYSGDGGDGGNMVIDATAGEGGAGGGGSYYLTESNNSHHATPGGGVGLYGQGTSGDAGIRNDTQNAGGVGGSGGDTGTWIVAGLYGAGARGVSSNNFFGAVNGANGAIRLIWGPGRAFPSTGTAEV